MGVHVLFTFLCAVGVIDCHLIFKWTSNSWPQTIANAPSNAPIFKVTYLQDRLNISCRTNKANANVTLNYQKNERSAFQSAVKRSKGKIVQLGQNFLLPSVKGADAGIYTCTAEDPCGTHLTLHKGHLIVLHVIKALPPEIIPKDSVSIQRSGNFVIACKTKGFGKATASLITWYKQLHDGTKKKIVTSVVSEKEVRRDYTVIDIEKLVFVNFTFADVGVYICERKLAGAQATSRSVKVTMKKSCVVDCSHFGEDPYCGSDGITYRNRCELYNAICRSKNKVEEKGKGPCEMKDTSEKDMRDMRKGSCEDDELRSRIGFCKMWKEDGLCARLPNTMKEYCPRTCAFC